MSSSYNGNAANATGTQVTITQPSDTDALTAASSNVGSAKLADWTQRLADLALVADGAKAWGNFTSGAGPTIHAGFNFASVTYPGGNVARVTFTTAMANANYAVVLNPGAGSTPRIAQVNTGQTTTYFDIVISSQSGTTPFQFANLDLSTAPFVIGFAVFST